jgi:hypothetical protein
VTETDHDGDGYTQSQGDCNDAAAGIHPGAAEICGDGVDQDCDGSDQVCTSCEEMAGEWQGSHSGIDCEGYSDGESWTAQVFADCRFVNYGSNSVTGTVNPVTRILTATTTTDECGDVSVSGVFVNNSLSGNYAFALGGGGTFFATKVGAEAVDNDGDGYTVAQGDCNDADASVFPDAPETCGDGIDQDCSGFDLDCEPDGN